MFLLSLARAAVGVRALAGPAWERVLTETDGEHWYPAAQFQAALAAITGNFRDASPVLERVGFEMMRAWYERGPGRTLAKGGVDFMRFQAGSEGYRSMVRGTDDETGSFMLEDLDVERGRASVRSTTPFDRSLERGVLLGGMQLAGDLDFVSVSNTPDPSHFEIRFA